MPFCARSYVYLYHIHTNGPDECYLNTIQACGIDVWRVVLEQKFGNETMHLSPPLEFVPWLVVNDQPIGNLSLSLPPSLPPSQIPVCVVCVLILLGFSSYCS
ncbi:putative gamma interferon inducible lysosomal thiol reductase GILT [Rosa chinensis]|uniref:Putative gamma interferon inducible lysosomal thiol reductase GILT n=1 Tax=Rosa chinensis TaxID=74649 RepID=A0A2P6R8V3_ROSCH|nr:putative gamma interferon inducible lysosomal thiol reductase GILT [Rosa chinensis]